MDINALLNLQPTGNRPGGDLARTQDGGFQGTLEAALAKSAAGATAAPGLNLLAGSAAPLTIDAATAALTVPASATGPALPPAAPLNLLAGDAAALLNPARAGTKDTTASGEPQRPIQETAERDTPAPEGLMALASAPTVPVASTPGDSPDTALTRQRSNAAIDTTARATPGPAPVEADAERHTTTNNNTHNTTATRPAPLTAGDAPTTAPPAAAVLEAERTSGRATAVAEPAPTATSPVQSAAAPPASTPTASPAPAMLQTPVASSGWGQELGQQVVNLTQRGDQHMELHLNPRDLGPLSISLKLDDQGAQAHFFSGHATVRGAVEQAIPQLRDALAQQGIALGEAMVGDQPRQQFSGQSGDGRPDGSPATAVTDSVDDTAGAGAGAQTTRTVVLPTSGVDLYA